MFKKSFAALAVLGFCASYANASSVILYGVVDEALVFTHEKFDVTGEEGTKTNTFGLESGLNAPSRFGLRGVEDLGNGLQVSRRRKQLQRRRRLPRHGPPLRPRTLRHGLRRLRPRVPRPHGRRRLLRRLL
ncbi:MAG: porin [Sutterella wadsworthensis]